MKVVLTIAGSDCSGGAGIQADIKTITAHRLYAQSVITAVTAQNTVGVSAVFPLPPEAVTQQLDCVFTDIFPDAVKIGMLANEGVIRAVEQALQKYRPKHIVLDPLMVSTSGHDLLDPFAGQALRALLPLATLITPNLPEAEALCSFPVHSAHDMERAAKEIAARFSTAVLIKGGHLEDGQDARDLLCCDGALFWFSAPRIRTANTHGTGCTLSSAIACRLAEGLSLQESISKAKAYLSGTMGTGLSLGKGNGPLNHMVFL